jgi:hypothetical protein
MRTFSPFHLLPFIPPLDFTILTFLSYPFSHISNLGISLPYLPSLSTVSLFPSLSASLPPSFTHPTSQMTTSHTLSETHPGGKKRKEGRKE